MDCVSSYLNLDYMDSSKKSPNCLAKGSKAVKHLFRPELVEDGAEETDPVVALGWDPLSSDYLLICNHHAGVRLVDIPHQVIKTNTVKKKLF